jgi:hypothetical protein
MVMCYLFQIIVVIRHYEGVECEGTVTPNLDTAGVMRQLGLL